MALLVVVTVGACRSSETAAPAPTPPNIIYILGDDHGYPYFGFMGDQTVRTPNLDQLAAESMVFPRAYTTASTCRLSLMTLLTGLHPEQWRAKNQMLEQQSGEERYDYRELIDMETLPKLLSRAGYATFQGGKYWEGTYDLAGFSHGMKYRLDQSAIDEFGQLGALSGGDGLGLGRETMAPVFNFIDEVSGKKPFFVWFAPLLPHEPHDAPGRYRQAYLGKGLSEGAIAYYANISWFDDVLGQLLAFLDQRGLRENTLLVYLSDNGWQQGPTEQWGIDGGPRGKNSVYDLGFRTPLLFSLPSVIAPGVNEQQLVSAVDLLPTMLGFAGLPTPEDSLGFSLHDRLTGVAEQAAPYRSDVVAGIRSVRAEFSRKLDDTLSIGREEEAYFVRDQQWRFVWLKSSNATELYDIENDPIETQNLAAGHPELVAKYQRRVDEWIAECRGLYAASG